MTSTSTINGEQPLVLSANLFPVVGIGASAGGLDAFKAFIKAIPADSGIAYVLVQHLSRDHESLLPELLQKITTIPVTEISDEIKVLPNNIYIIPSNTMLIANDGVLQLSPRPAKNIQGQNLPIDLFFNSLAEVHLSHSIGVVLSGNGADGTTGLTAIKENGGVTFVQDPSTADYASMPNSAIKAGVADFILPPEEMPAKLVEIMRLLESNDKAFRDNSMESENAVKEILSILLLRKGTDFSAYKRPTIIRRVFRRMILNKHDTYASYIRLLLTSKPEQDALYADLLIKVTSFFRDPKVFTHLCKEVFPHIIKESEPGLPIRVWIAGCCTGEEAYSIAICFRESLGDDKQELQIFATDISEPSIEKARAGLYTEKECVGVSPDRLRTYFTKTPEGYRINRELRECCVFAVHNFIQDPPFSKIDFVSCRNVLIYMETYLQKTALTNFHYALAPKGYLLLGKAETTDPLADHYLIFDKKQKVYSRKDVAAKFVHIPKPKLDIPANLPQPFTRKKKIQTDFRKTADDIMLKNFTPAGVVINESFDIVHFRGDTKPYLQQSDGKPTHNILNLATSEISFELRNMLLKMKKENLLTIKKEILPGDFSSGHSISLEIIAMPELPDIHYLVLFHKNPVYAQHVSLGSLTMDTEKDLRINQLEREITRSREDMRDITEEQENVNNELQSANEELLSGSEELQSLNEELETSKEELQSTNEELTVLNQELISLNEQLHNSAQDQKNIQTRLATQALMVHNLLMSAPAFVCTMTGPEHRYDVVNELYQGLFGKREIKGKPIMEALPELEGQGFNKILDDVYRTGVPYVGIEFALKLARDIDKEPEQRYFNFSYQPMYDEDNKIHAILVFGYEVTDQVNAKIMLDTINKQHGSILEATIEQQSSELEETNRRLYAKNTKLQAANRELESFTFITSHDLQEPLRKIQLFSAKIKADDEATLSENGRNYFERINKSAYRMQTLLKDLMEYSRMQHAERVFEATDLEAMLHDLSLEFTDSLEEKNGHIEVSSLPNIRAIPYQMRQLFNNLISNALKFSKEGVPALISIKRASRKDVIEGMKHILHDGKKTLPDPAKFIGICFTDNGIGFDEKYNETVFKVFQRLHSKEEYRGTGIGLAIVKKIMENHGGFITASGKKGEGTSFLVLLPS